MNNLPNHNFPSKETCNPADYEWHGCVAVAALADYAYVGENTGIFLLT